MNRNRLGSRFCMAPDGAGGGTLPATGDDPTGATPTPAAAAGTPAATPPPTPAPAQAAAGNGGTGATPTPDTGATPEPEHPKDSPNKTIGELRDDLARANARIKELNGENREHRQKAQIAEADRAELEAYRKLGLKPDTIRERLQAHQQVNAENATLKRDGLLRDVAERASLKFGVLRSLDRLSNEGRSEPLRYESREVEIAGSGGKKEAKEFVVYKDGETEKAELLEEFAAREWADYLPALRAAPPKAVGTPIIRQTPSEGAASTASGVRRKPGGLF